MKKYIILLIWAIPLFFFYMIYKAHHDKINYRTIVDEKLPPDFEGYRIFYISDIHRRYIKRATLESIDNQIDAIIIGGDLTEKKVPLCRIKENIHRLKKWNAPIYFVWGNNDYETNVNELNSLLLEQGITVLANSSENIKRGKNKISLLGLDCSVYKEARIDLALEEACGEYNILLTHIPSSFFELNQETRNKINFMLGGHTHGGQIRIFGLGPYERGYLHKVKPTSILISEGYGYTMLPFRLGTNAECHVLTLRKDLM